MLLYNELSFDLPNVKYSMAQLWQNSAINPESYYVLSEMLRINALTFFLPFQVELYPPVKM